MIRVLFPQLWSNDRDNSQLTQEEQRIFYEKGVHPAIVEISPEDATDWPTNYDSELWRARKRKGGFTFSTRPVAEWNIYTLSRTLRRKLEAEVAWAKDFKFLHQVRGVKLATVHGANRDAAETALEEFKETNCLDIDPDETSWWIDVGMEYCWQGRCLQWRTDSHFHMARHVLAIPGPDADRITSLGSSKYERDLSSHFTGLSGCRIKPGVRAQGPYQACYLQMYTTEKSLTYHPEGLHHGKALIGSDVIKAKENIPFCDGLYNTYVQARETNDSNARIEIRVPLSHASAVLTDIPSCVVSDSLVGVPRGTWW